LELEALTVGDVANLDSNPSSVPGSATPAQIQEESRRTGHLRLLVRGDGSARPVEGVVHVRDTVNAAPGTAARDLMRPVLALDASTPAYSALQTMRETRSHLAVIQRDGHVSGLITLTDVLGRLLPTGSDSR
jgi:CBS domain containing-hemolysin-like protein